MWIIIGGGLCCLIHYGLNCFTKSTFKKDSHNSFNQIKPWDISWSEFLLFFWTLLIALFLITTLAAEIHSFRNNKDTSESSIFILIQGLFVQIGILVTITIYGLRFSPNHFFAFNFKQLNVLKKCTTAIHHFLVAIPLIVFLQLAIQKGLNYWGLPVNQQEIIHIIAQTQSLSTLCLIIFSVVVLAPLTEEILFRGIIHRFLKSKMGLWYSMITNAFIFALVHFNLFSFIPLFVLGLLLTLSYEKSGNITVPILFHALFNANSMIFILSKSALS